MKFLLRTLGALLLLAAVWYIHKAVPEADSVIRSCLTESVNTEKIIEMIK